MTTSAFAGKPSSPAFLDRIRLYVDFTRPFTLLPPTFGVISGAITAIGSAHNPDPLRRMTASVLLTICLGSLCAALLNAASNGINQYYDLENDKRNKPNRPLVTGAISMRAGWWFSLVLYILAVAPTWLVVTYPRTSLQDKLFAPLSEHQCIFIYLLGMIATFVYSAPAWGRTKAHPIGANVTIAIPRGCLLKVAGWSMVASVFHIEPWYIGGIFGLFLLGAATTKDFSDMEGDRIANCRTLPIVYGVRKAAYMIAPFFVIPWLLVPIGALVRNPWDPAHHILTGNPVLLTILGIALAIWGAYTVYLLVRNPDDLARVENHPSWTHMYMMMMAAQIGFAVAYLVPHHLEAIPVSTAGGIGSPIAHASQPMTHDQSDPGVDPPPADRDLTKYVCGGLIGPKWPSSMEEVENLETKLRAFVWLHWTKKELSYIQWITFSKEGQENRGAYYIEPDKSGKWRLRGEIWRGPMRKFEPRMDIFDIYEIRRLATGQNLELKDATGRVVDVL